MTSPRQWPRLVFLEGPKRGEELVFDCDELTIGRAPRSTLLLSEPTVSRNHAVIRRLQDGYEIEDLRSDNGTSVNGRLISGKVKLNPGDEIRIGSSVVQFDMTIPRP